MVISRKFITECVTQVIKELSDKTYQDASEIAFDNDDMRVQKFRKQAEREYNQARNGYRAYDSYDGFDNDGWIQLNNGKKLFLFDDSLPDEFVLESSDSSSSSSSSEFFSFFCMFFKCVNFCTASS